MVPAAAPRLAARYPIGYSIAFAAQAAHFLSRTTMTAPHDRTAPLPHAPDEGRRTTTLALVGLGFAAAGIQSARADTGPLSLEGLKRTLEAGPAIVYDIREPREHATGVIPGARLLPLSQAGQRLAEIPTDPATPVYLICNTQNRSKALLGALRQRGGYDHVRMVEGGMSEWARRGWPMVKPGG